MNLEQKSRNDVSLSLDIELRKELKKIIENWERQGRYETYSSFIGKAINAYLKKELTVKDYQTGRKESYHVVLEPEQIAFYKSLPIRKRYKVINSILVSYLKKELDELN